MKHQPKIKEHSIVLIGNFNPKIFQPAWFAAQGLLSQQEAEEAKIEIIHSSVVIFNTNTNWMRMEITDNRFIVKTSQEPYDVVIRDLVLGTFDLLRYTPIMQMGINREMHFQLSSDKIWHKAGDLLTPKEIWAGILNKPGMLSVQMRDSERNDGLKGNININVAPSNKFPNGLFISVNDHIETEKQITTEGCGELIDILNKHWERSYKRSEEIMYSLLERLEI
ncbi:hypothetical protein BMS3Abin06_01444 [bacterium BMS3Abin06]|nr:hypothetical protein BMS3Abin06_01444 [bacterium BMS3Abin06]HDZ01570.1 hypothetical protein [Nitrospirota bacterium]